VVAVRSSFRNTRRSAARAQFINHQESIMRISIVFALVAALGVAGSALADESVKAGGPTDKPGRTLESDSVKSGGGDKRPGRAVDGDVVKSGGSTDKPGRQVERTN
jgi:hypothetical protein